jgi:hypothetical protein
MSETNGHRAYRDTEAEEDIVLKQICNVLQGLRFGSVTIVVQDGVVVQIDRTEKRRIQPGSRRLVALAQLANASGSTSKDIS